MTTENGIGNVHVNMNTHVRMMVFYLQRKYSDIRTFSRALLKFCEVLAHLTVHYFRPRAERVEETATMMYCAALFVLHVAVKLDKLFK